MQAMLLSLEEQGRPGVAYEDLFDMSDGAAGGTATGSVAAAAQRAHVRSEDPQFIAAAAANLGCARTAGLEAQAAGRRTALQAALEQPWGLVATSSGQGDYPEDHRTLECNSSRNSARNTFGGLRNSSAAQGSSAFSSEVTSY